MSYGRICGAFVPAPSQWIKSLRSPQDSAGKRRKALLSKATRIGLEPTTPSVTGWCSNQLSYRAISGTVRTAPSWSGRRGSNSLPPPWQGGALPDELRPHMRKPLQASGFCGASDRNRTNDTGIFSPLLYLLSYRGAPDDDYYTPNFGFVKRKIEIFSEKIKKSCKNTLERSLSKRAFDFCLQPMV